jgi:hypothetical protein
MCKATATESTSPVTENIPLTELWDYRNLKEREREIHKVIPAYGSHCPI